jgi:hypothetical protein
MGLSALQVDDGGEQSHKDGSNAVRGAAGNDAMKRKNSTDASIRYAMGCEIPFSQSRFAFNGLVMTVGLREIGKIATAC